MSYQVNVMSGVETKITKPRGVLDQFNLINDQFGKYYLHYSISQVCF